MKKIKIILVCLMYLFTTYFVMNQPAPVDASTAISEGYIGEITLVACNFEPKGTMDCRGQILPISQHAALFSLIGTTYGGDGRSTFQLPNLIGYEPVPNMHYVINILGVYPSRYESIGSGVYTEIDNKIISILPYNFTPLNMYNCDGKSSFVNGQPVPDLRSTSLLPSINYTICDYDRFQVYILSEIILVSSDFQQNGFMDCNGATLQISQNSALFALLGTNYGGNGTTTFAIPNLSNMAPSPDTKYVICVQGVFPPRN